MADISLAARPPVFIVDDDVALCGALSDLLRLDGWLVESFACTESFLGRVTPSAPGVLLLDVDLPDIGGVELQTHLTGHGDLRPIIFMTGHEQVSIAIDAMKGGAIEYLIKPFDEATVLDAVNRAAAKEVVRLKACAERADLAAKFSALTPREKQVLGHVVSGKLNKQIAGEMAIAEITVKVHRASLMHKLKTSSVAALVRFHDRLFASDG